MLKKVKSDWLYLGTRDVDDNVYTDTSNLYLLVEADQDSVRLFDLNNLDTYEGTPAEFNQLVQQGELTHCRYFMMCAVYPPDVPEGKTTAYGTNMLDKFYEFLVKLVKDAENGAFRFDACYIHDQRTGELMLHKNDLADLTTALQKYSPEQQTFKPKPADTAAMAKKAIQSDNDALPQHAIKRR